MKDPILKSNKDKQIFFDELSNPSKPNKALIDAVEIYEKHCGAVKIPIVLNLLTDD